MRNAVGMIAFVFLLCSPLPMSVWLIKPSLIKIKGGILQRKQIVMIYLLFALGFVMLMLFAALGGISSFVSIALAILLFSVGLAKTEEYVKLVTTPTTSTQADAKDLELHQLRSQLNSEQKRADSLSEQLALQTKDIEQPTKKTSGLGRERLTEIISAIIADDAVSIDEVTYLIRWIEDKQVLKDGKAKRLYDILTQYAADGELSETEEADLLERFYKWTGLKRKAYIPKTEPTIEVRPTTNWAGMTVAFDYVAATGESSHRRVKVSTDKAGKIFGYCHTRSAMRSFLKDRMSQVIDIDSGELLQD